MEPKWLKEAQEIVKLLSSCFGGRSKWGSTDLGRAISDDFESDRVRNPMELLREIAAMERDYWDWPKTEEQDFLRDAIKAFNKE